MNGTLPVVALTRRVFGDFRVPGAEVRCHGDAKITREQMLGFVRGAAVIVPMYTDRVDDEMLAAAGPQLKGVCQFAVGYDNIDAAACRKRGVIVTNTPHAVTEGTADLAWALVLAVARGIPQADAYARSPEYAANQHLAMSERVGMDLAGKNLLILGAGRIGYAVAVRSLGWGMRVSYVARSRHHEFEMAPFSAKRVSLEEGLRDADVVSVHSPLTPETRHLLNRETLGKLKRTAIVVNTARGPVIDEAALADALREGRLFGAGLDVYEKEPEVHPGLIGLDNVVLTPHIGSASIRSRDLMREMVAENAAAIVAGKEPPNRVA